MIYNKSTLFIVNDIANFILEMRQTLPKHSIRVIRNDDENKKEFLIADAQKAIKEAYISTSELKYIFLCGDSFRVEAQNALLKVLEEPPKNIEFIIISPTKSNLLPTVRSRLPILKGKVFHDIKELGFSLQKIDYAQIFSFLKENSRISKTEAKELVEAIFYRATVTDKLILSSSQLQNFDRAYRLLELNSKPQSVLAQLLMGFAS